MAKLPHKFTMTRKSASKRIREGLIALESFRLPYRNTPEALWIETSKFAFIFDRRYFSKRKVHEFNAWYVSHAKTSAGLATLPIGITPKKIRRDRDWSAFPGASAKPTAPLRPIRPASTGTAMGSQSTVPGHLAELDSFDLRKR